MTCERYQKQISGWKLERRDSWRLAPCRNSVIAWNYKAIELQCKNYAVMLTSLKIFYAYIWCCRCCCALVIYEVKIGKQWW